MNNLRTAALILSTFALSAGAIGGDNAATPRPRTEPIEQKYAVTPLGSYGLANLAELRGKPVVITCWGKTCPQCLEHTLPTALKLKDRFGDSVQFVFVEGQNASLDEYEAVAWRMNAMWNGAMWTSERPPVEYTAVPTVIVLGVDGRVLLVEGGQQIGTALEKTVEQEVKLSKLPPPGTPKELVSAWQAFLRDDVGAAIALCEKLSTPEAAAAKTEFLMRVEGRIARTEWKLRNGFLSSMEKDLEGLAKAVKGNSELSQKVAAGYAGLASAGIGPDLDADKDFIAFLGKLKRDSPFDPAALKKAQASAEKYKGTRTAERYERYLLASRVDISKFTK